MGRLETGGACTRQAGSSLRRSTSAVLVAGLVGASILLAGCAGDTTVRNGVPVEKPTPAQQQAARQAELRSRARAHTDLAAAYYARAQYAVALEEAADALAADPSYAGAWNLKGLVYMALREDREAEDSFRQGLRLAPRDSELANNYGYFLCERDRSREGLAVLDPVLRDPLYQTPERALVNASRCASRLGEAAAATQYLRRAVALAPTDIPAATAYAEGLERDGQYGLARETLRPLLRQEPPPAEVLRSLVRLDERLNDAAQAREHRALLQRFWADPGAAPAGNAGATPADGGRAGGMQERDR